LQTLLTPRGRPSIWFGCKRARKYSQTFLPGLLCRRPWEGVWKNALFTNISLYLGNGRRYGRSYNGIL